MKKLIIIISLIVIVVIGAATFVLMEFDGIKLRKNPGITFSNSSTMSDTLKVVTFSDSIKVDGMKFDVGTGMVYGTSSGVTIRDTLTTTSVQLGSTNKIYIRNDSLFIDGGTRRYYLNLADTAAQHIRCLYVIAQ